jgi:hypothetical protein
MCCVRSSLSGEQFPLGLPQHFVLRGRDADHFPQPRLAQHEAYQHGQQLLHGQFVGLRPAVSPVHFDAGRIHHDVLHPVGLEKPMQPEAIASRFIDTVDRRIGWQAKPTLGVSDLCQEPLQVPGPDRDLPRGLPQSDGEPHRPVVPTEFQRHVQHPRLRATL